MVQASQSSKDIYGAGPISNPDQSLKKHFPNENSKLIEYLAYVNPL